MLEFKEGGDWEIVITNDAGKRIGDFMLFNGKYTLLLSGGTDKPEYLRQIAAKLEELNGK